jgi:hypothetical protein
MTTLEFLKSKGLIAEGNSEFVIKFEDGREFELNRLIGEFDIQRQYTQRELQRKNENLQEVLKQSCQRFNAQLMSVFYLLGSLQKMGTHHEKEVAIRFLRTTIGDLLQKGGDHLEWDQELFNIPF